MGERLSVDSRLEVCAGNKLIKPEEREFRALKAGNEFRFEEVVKDRNASENLFIMGGKDACQVIRQICLVHLETDPVI